MNDVKPEKLRDIATSCFMNLLWLRIIILQDAIYLRKKNPYLQIVRIDFGLNVAIVSNQIIPQPHGFSFVIVRRELRFVDTDPWIVLRCANICNLPILVPDATHHVRLFSKHRLIR